MKVTMNSREEKCRTYCARFKKSWDTYCIAGDSYINGYKQALLDTENYLKDLTDDDYLLTEEVGTDKVEVEINNGDHQIGAKITDGVNND